MASETAIRAAIESRRGSVSYSAWTIGVTDNPARRREEHRGGGANVASWIAWDADSEAVARAVESYFIGKGMKGGTGGSGRADYVYIF